MTSKDVVLIIEDSAAIGMLLEEFLDKLDYSDIKIAETGVTALKEPVENKTYSIGIYQFFILLHSFREILISTFIAF